VVVTFLLMEVPFIGLFLAHREYQYLMREVSHRAYPMSIRKSLSCQTSLEMSPSLPR